MSVKCTDGVGAGREAVEQLVALSGRGRPLTRAWAAREPRCGLARALAVMLDADRLADEELKRALAEAFEDARDAGEWEAGVVYGIYLYTHRQYRLTADHLLRHFAAHPLDEVAGLLLGAFAACQDARYRAAGDHLIERQQALAGPGSWVWASQLAWVRAEQGRVEEAYELAEQALRLYPRSGVAVHARAHAEQELGAGPDSSAFVDAWLAEDPDAVQFRHLNWHAALQSLAHGDFPGARRRADEVLAREDVGMRAATNWRLLLAGQAPARRSGLEQVRALLAEPGGTAEVFHAFNLALALATHGAVDDLLALAHRSDRDARTAFSEVLAPVVRALAHLCAGRPAEAVDRLAPLGERVEELGGVRVEREIVQDTLARALADLGHGRRAADLLHHRRTRRRHHAYEDLLLVPRPARAAAPAGCRTLEEASR